MKYLSTYKIFEEMKIHIRPGTPDQLGEALCYYVGTDMEIPVIKEFIKVGANINFQDEQGYTPLMVCAQNGKQETLKILINAGADLNIKDNIGRTALFHAALNGNTICFKIIVDAGAELNSITYDSKTLLMLLTNTIPSVTSYLHPLLSKKADPDIQDKEGNTALMYAAKNGNKFAITTLINAGANISLSNNNGNNFIDELCKTKNSKNSLGYEFNGKKWLREMTTQRMILNKDETLINTFNKYNISIDSTVKDEFPHLFIGMDLNLL